MIKIQKLKKPTRHSGHPLAPGKATFVRGVRIVNQNSYTIYVDKWTRKDYKKPKKKKRS